MSVCPRTVAVQPGPERQACCGPHHGLLKKCLLDVLRVGPASCCHKHLLKLVEATDAVCWGAQPAADSVKVAQDASVWVWCTCLILACWQLLAGIFLGRCMPKGVCAMLPQRLHQ